MNCTPLPKAAKQSLGFTIEVNVVAIILLNVNSMKYKPIPMIKRTFKIKCYCEFSVDSLLMKCC